MGVPKRKKSRSRTRMRKAHQALPGLQTVACPNCGEPSLPHRMCTHCGQYHGRSVKEVEEAT